MPLNPLNFRSQEATDWSSLGNLFENYWKGYEMSQTPERLQREREMQQLQQALLQTQAKYAEPLAQANVQKALKGKQSDFATLLAEREALKQDPNANKQEISLYDALLNRKANGAPGIELSVGPNGEIMFTQGGTAAKGSNQQFYLDKDGNVVNVSKPSAKATNVHQAQQRASAELEYASPYITQPYEGAGSNAALYDDLKLYKATKNEAAKERLVQGALAYLMVPDISLWQLQSLAAETTVPAISRQEKTVTTGWAETGPWFFNNLPKELIKEAKDRQKRLIHETKEVSAKQFTQGFPTIIGGQKGTPAAQNKPVSEYTNEELLEAYYANQR